MDSISRFSINDIHVRPINTSDLKKVNIATLDDESFHRYMQSAENLLKAQHINKFNTDDSPAYRPFATIEKAGVIIAEIDNNGFVKSTNSLGAQLVNLFGNESSSLQGPNLAHSRARLIADYTNAEINISASALSQKDYESLSHMTPSIDYMSMQSDPFYQSLEKIKKAREEYVAKQESVSNEISRLTDRFNDWQAEYLSSGLSMDRVNDVHKHSKEFVSIIHKAVEHSGYDNPKQFLKSLSTNELETLRIMNSLADTIHIDELDNEGAVNLILPKNEVKDLNNDGFTMVGKARTWSFPPPNAPEEVKAAWKAATANLSAGEKMLAMTPFMPILINVDDSGRVHEINPSEANNIYASADFSYVNYVEDRLEALEYFKAQTPVDQYRRTKDFLTNFLSKLNQYEAV